MIYAVNWFNIASIFPMLAVDFAEDISGLGSISGSFYLGLGIFQIPGGLLAARVGPRRTATYGTMLASSAALLSGLISEFYQLTLLRFIVGAGMALVFAPGVTLMAKYYRRGAEGLGVGFFNTAFHLGGVVGLFGWVLLGHLVGWRLSLVSSGGLGIVTALLVWLFVPRDYNRSDFRFTIHALRGVLLNRTLLILSVTLVGMSVGTSLIGSFIVYYLQDSMGAAATTAGAVGGLTFAVAFLASPIAGRLFDRTRNVPWLLLMSGAILSVGVAATALGTFYAALVAVILTGISSGAAYTVGFAAAREAEIPDPEYETFAVSWVNSISLSAAFWSPVVFSFTVIRFGYPIAWVSGSLYSFMLVLPILMLRKKTSGA